MFYVGYLWIASAHAKTITALKSWGYGVLIAVVPILLCSWPDAWRIPRACGWSFCGGAIFDIFRVRARRANGELLRLAILVILGVGLYAVRNTKFVQKLPGRPFAAA